MRYVAIRSEGGLLPYDLLDKIVADQIAGQKPIDFGLPKGQRLIDEISRVWADAQNLWSNFKRRRQSLTERDPYGTSITRTWIVSLLSDPEMLGFDLKLQTGAVVVNNVTFAISHRNGDGDGAIPVHIEGCKIDLDRRLHTKLRTSPQAMLQDFLNNSEECSWGILTNGVTLRLLRDSSRTSRPTYLEFDLESILEGNRFNEFALFYRLCHRTRFPKADQEPSDCLLEKYYLDSIEQGLRVRDKLRDGVEEALKILGTAFLQHPANEKLRAGFAAGKLTAETFHRQLLLLVYRLLFLMVAEERGLIVALGDHADRNQKIYDEWYGVSRLRERSSRIVEASPFSDVWIGLKQTFSLFEYGLDANALGIPPLNGDLFNEKRAIPDLALAELYNHELLVAVRHLSLFKSGNAYQRVSYSGLDVEELGSVYESLLDYKPVITQGDRGLIFDLRTGTERKSTGSYYTRPELVHELVESALVPVMEERIATAEKTTEGKNLIAERDEKIRAILGLTVCDPACGSGHFLLAAARRLGKELARVRTGEDEPRPEDFHLAVRDVISHCVYGVDLNPLAVDLCKVALWLESHWAGKPLSFLDNRIRCGNSLVGVLDPEVMAEGIPDDAFTALSDDDKKVAAVFKKRNKQERTSRQRGFSFEPDDHASEYVNARRQLEAMSDDNAAAVRRKAEVYSSWRAGMQHSHDEAVADLWTAQFFNSFTQAAAPNACTTRDFLEFAVDKQKKPLQVGVAQALAQEHRFFHWYLEFPEVFDKKGFDVILGNPPWERIKLQEEEHWADDAYISAAPTKAQREERIQEYRLSNDPKKKARLKLFDDARHGAEAGSKFARGSARFPLTAVGDINTYGLFAELGRTLIKTAGRAGIIVQSGIGTDDTYKKFFGDIVEKEALVSFFDFVNLEGFFPGIHRTHPHFCALTVSGQPRQMKVDFAFFLTRTDQLRDPQRRFHLMPSDLKLLNPNTRTCPVFRTRADASLTKKIYEKVPVLVNERTGENPWETKFLAMFHMSNDSALFKLAPGDGLVRLYESKFVHQYDHRWATWDSGEVRDCRDLEKRNARFRICTRFWIKDTEVLDRVAQPRRKWLLGFRSLTNTTNERTAIFSIIPFSGVGNSFIVLDSWPHSAALTACFLANANSFVLDYVVRQKMGGTNFNFFILNQLPFLSPDAYSKADQAWVAERVLRLVYTAGDLEGFAADLGYRGPCFEWDPAKRASDLAELDAYYAHLYGLTRDELQYVLDPQSVLGGEFPGETFRVLKERELRDHGEYRTRDRVLAAYDNLAVTDRFRTEVQARISVLEQMRKSARSAAG